MHSHVVLWDAVLHGDTEDYRQVNKQKASRRPSDISPVISGSDQCAWAGCLDGEEGRLLCKHIGQARSITICRHVVRIPGTNCCSPTPLRRRVGEQVEQIQVLAGHLLLRLRLLHSLNNYFRQLWFFRGLFLGGDC